MAPRAQARVGGERARRARPAGARRPANGRRQPRAGRPHDEVRVGAVVLRLQLDGDARGAERLLRRRAVPGRRVRHQSVAAVPERDVVGGPLPLQVARQLDAGVAAADNNNIPGRAVPALERLPHERRVLEAVEGPRVRGRLRRLAAQGHDERLAVDTRAVVQRRALRVEVDARDGGPFEGQVRHTAQLLEGRRDFVGVRRAASVVVEQRQEREALALVDERGLDAAVREVQGGVQAREATAQHEGLQGGGGVQGREQDERGARHDAL